jgi:hypothetical protein
MCMHNYYCTKSCLKGMHNKFLHSNISGLLLHHSRTYMHMRQSGVDPPTKDSDIYQYDCSTTPYTSPQNFTRCVHRKFSHSSSPGFFSPIHWLTGLLDRTGMCRGSGSTNSETPADGCSLPQFLQEMHNKFSHSSSCCYHFLELIKLACVRGGSTSKCDIYQYCFPLPVEAYNKSAQQIHTQQQRFLLLFHTIVWLTV